jgi:flavin-dependent dehydrogenase
VTSDQLAAVKLSSKEEARRKLRVAVIGGGPAGSTAAALIAQGGHGNATKVETDVTIYEREDFPRFHIGESLITETWWTLERLGLIERMKKTAFPRKYSVQFFSADGRPSRPFYFRDSNPHESSVTWQVERSEFDSILLENAVEKGAKLRSRVDVKKILFDGERAVGIRLKNEEGIEEDVATDIVVDASGLGAVTARQLGLIEVDERLRKAAVFAHFRGAHRDPGIDEGATLVLSTAGNRGWFWYIPLAHDVVSVGVVGDSAELIRGRGRPEDILQAEIESCPTVRERTRSAERVSPVRVLNDFSYRARRCAGDGWVLVGDAFGFIDPVYSTGVFLGMKSAEMAADAVLDATRAGDLSGQILGRYGPEISSAMESLRKLVHAFYTPGFSFADFVRKHPEHAPRIVDLLTGNVFKPGVRDIFNDMKDYCTIPEDRPLESSALPLARTAGTSAV